MTLKLEAATVSIRSPHRSEGRCLRYTFVTPSLQFQSAPPTGVRGDENMEKAAAGSSKVSIRSPHRSEGRSDRGLCAIGRAM